MALLGQVPHRPVGGIVIVHFDQGDGAVLGHVGVHAQEGKALLLEQMDDLFIVNLDEDHAVGVLAVDGVHQLAALRVGLHGGENHAVTQGLALPENAR